MPFDFKGEQHERVSVSQVVKGNDVRLPVLQRYGEPDHIRVRPVAVSRFLRLLVENRLSDDLAAPVEGRIGVGEVRQYRMQIAFLEFRFALRRCPGAFRLVNLRNEGICDFCFSFLEEESRGSFADLREAGRFVVANVHVELGPKAVPGCFSSGLDFGYQTEINPRLP